MRPQKSSSVTSSRSCSSYWCSYGIFMEPPPPHRIPVTRRTSLLPQDMFRTPPLERHSGGRIGGRTWLAPDNHTSALLRNISGETSHILKLDPYSARQTETELGLDWTELDWTKLRLNCKLYHVCVCVCLQVFPISQVLLMNVALSRSQCTGALCVCVRVMLLCVLTVCLLSTEADGKLAQLNETLQDRLTFSGHLGFSMSELAGMRSFVPDQEMETRIVGGQEAWAHSWPWQVSLQFASTSACGGAIISSLWVISAAHCFKRYNQASYWTVLAGKHDLENPQEKEQQLVGVSTIVSHPSYNSQTKDNDVALLRLQQPLIFNQFVRPIDICTTPLPQFTECTVTGWGSTRENGPGANRLQEVNVTILPFDVCNQYYRGRVTPSMFCAGKDQGGVDACQGDSGGPLSCFTGTRYELAGLVSWGVGCARARRPGVYSKVQPHAQWISDTMNNQDMPTIDDRTTGVCGKKQSSSCDRAPGLAELSVSQDNVVSVENVVESCPFFWPWQVSLQSNGRHYCSGVLIHRWWVLTAKHCSVRAEQDVVVLGVHDLQLLSAQTILVEEVFNPMQDASFPPKSDLSLLRLSVAAHFGSKVSPVCVPQEDEDLNDSWSCVTAGWGATKATVRLNPDRLHHAGLTLVNRSACRQKWGGFISDAHICSHPSGSTSCMGDSGAPLFCQKQGTYFLFGMVTWGSWRCDAEKPAIFTRISDYLLWIREVTEDI
ncbi:ovochymase-1 [Parambassis ranga]|uniref:Ovochymase-1 n=1 Tax=Parambassis ranga TaxID=210632 RepID=A0A6P7HU95_9TELE|nr:transmembrane protease serine 9-like [Parambassis ranga]